MFFNLPQPMFNVTLQTAEVIVIATIESFQSGMMTMSLPPQCHYMLKLNEVETLKGELPEGPVKIIIEGDEKPIVGKPVALFGVSEQGYFAFTGMTEDIEEAKAAI